MISILPRLIVHSLIVDEGPDGAFPLIHLGRDGLDILHRILVQVQKFDGSFDQIRHVQRSVARDYISIL